MRLSSKIRVEPLSLAFAVFGGLVLLFIVAPLISMFVRCSPGELVETAKDAEVRNSIWLTLWTSMAATVIFAVAAIPFAYLLARKDFPLKRLVTAIIDLPVVIPHSAAGIALLGVISRNGFLGKAAGKIGFSFVDSVAGIMMAMAFVSIPYLINSARDGFLAVPVRLEKAALSLGASPLQVFLTVSVPLAWRAILSGLILMWARGMSEFGAVLIIAYQPMITPVLIYERFTSFGLKYARPVAVLFISVCLIFFITLRLLAREKQNA
ncbi:MAG: ABC transporter permease [Planctomycetes bacterium]|nr:ABC transporter permease [Planctomycetota bacterium]MCH8119016.1 ABC transporter permease [Planctomycetota bacterium]